MPMIGANRCNAYLLHRRTISSRFPVDVILLPDKLTLQGNDGKQRQRGVCGDNGYIIAVMTDNTGVDGVAPTQQLLAHTERQHSDVSAVYVAWHFCLGGKVVAIAART